MDDFKEFMEKSGCMLKQICCRLSHDEEIRQLKTLKYSDRVSEINKDMLMKSRCMRLDESISKLLMEMDYMLSNECILELSGHFQNTEEIKPTISTLKKRIKYCKTPLERKRLEKELNKTYKEQKRKR